MRSVRFLAWSLGLFCLAIFGLTAAGHYGGDGLFIYETSESLVLDQSVVIGQRVHHWPGDFVSGQAGTLQPSVSKYDIGMVLAEVPLLATGHLIAKAIPQLPHDHVTMLLAAMTNVRTSPN